MYMIETDNNFNEDLMIQLNKSCDQIKGKDKMIFESDGNVTEPDLLKKMVKVLILSFGSDHYHAKYGLFFSISVLVFC